MNQHQSDGVATSSAALHPCDTGSVSGVEPGVGEPMLYEFDPAHVVPVVRAIDDAFRRAGSRNVALLLSEVTLPPDLVPASSLKRELLLAVTYSLHLSARGEKAGCTLDPGDRGADNAWLPAIRTTAAPVVQLWREVAAGVVVPSAVAHFEDLLICRRDGNMMQRVARAGTAYLDAAQGVEVTMPVVEMLMRAWTLARSVKKFDLEARARSAMFAIASDVLHTQPGERAGVVLPLLAALAVEPIKFTSAAVADVHDVDTLLATAAEAFSRGYLASEIARLRRSRAQGPADLEAIARDEVAAYLRSAEQAPHPAVRMIRLEAAARLARSRGLTDLVRVTATAMQAIKPADLGFITFTDSSTLPPYVVEGIVSDYTKSPDWRVGMAFFLESLPPTGDVADLRNHARNRSQTGLLSAFLPTMLFASGLPRKTAATDAERELHEMSLFAGTLAETNGRLLATALHRLAAHYGTPEEDDLVEFLMSHGGRDPCLARSLAKAFCHFWNGDYESCIHLAVPQFEKAARSLLIELDEGIYQVQKAQHPGGYPTLYALIAELDNLALHESWAYFFRWLLGGPFGANLRNNVAHGLPAEMSPVNAALILRAVSLLAVVVGAMDHRVNASSGAEPRDREAVLALLASPLQHRGRLDRLLRWVARRLERAAWTVDLARIRKAHK